MSLDTALNTNSMGGIISDMTKKQREATEAQAGMDSAVAKKTTELRAPLLKEQEQAIGAKESQISQVGQEMTQPFVMPKETANDMATYGSMVGLIGVMLGASGKNSGMNQLAALTGLAKGYREGRKDLVDKSYKEFEVNQKRLQGLMQQAKTELDVIMQKYKVRDESVVQNIAEFKANYANSIAAKIADGQSADKVASLQMDIKRFEQQASQHAARIAFDNKKYNAEQERYKAEQEAKKRTPVYQDEHGMYNSKGELIPNTEGKQKFGTKTSPLAEGMPKTDSEIQKSINRYQTFKNLEDLDFMLNNPKYSKYITPTTKITPDILQRLRKDFPELEQRLARMQTGEFLIGGKALTGNEIKVLDPIFGWKSRTADYLRTQVKIAKQELQNNILMNEAIYPGLTTKRKKFNEIYDNSKTGIIPATSVLESGLSDTSSQLSNQERDAAMAWIAANPNDSRVPDIKKKLGVQ